MLIAEVGIKLAVIDVAVGRPRMMLALKSELFTGADVGCAFGFFELAAFDGAEVEDDSADWVVAVACCFGSLDFGALASDVVVGASVCVGAGVGGDCTVGKFVGAGATICGEHAAMVNPTDPRVTILKNSRRVQVCFIRFSLTILYSIRLALMYHSLVQNLLRKCSSVVKKQTKETGFFSLETLSCKIQN